MPRKFTQLAFTPAVKAIQEKYGSRQTYARFEESGPSNDTITPDIAQFIAERDGFYLGTVSSNGYPYIQFRGGSPGFLKVLDEQTLGFADFKGNVQYVTVGNLTENDKAFLFLMDYRNRRRLKVWGRAVAIDPDPDWVERLKMPDYPAEVEHVILFHIEAWNWNCPQHIPVRYTEAEVAAIAAPLHTRIAELEQLVAHLRQP
ncbi:pyridoxamine 5'-phosphate oxidase family protein [Oculatella sp. LEGE 06141]|uniref:pyridoxamine 5'-phosphate oxidase family protein n=1 Tax=Oculatella sp. LEGE 06141 TaxID=1828648 RepID=UPI0018830908|nr:pyridoxamine 5'-phosphate oxidase family protein [Oculatella sp. LEGE 06141]MBE9180123.1 pyridoxamine 5'-phosphate oxidase family protein [Oculatella sp. LEGE 06141]